MEKKRQSVYSHRLLRLAEKLRNPKYRHTYVAAHTRQFLARQIREMRGSDSQAEFGKQIDKAQNLVSRYEDPAYGKWTLSTLLEIAKKLDRALIVRFVDFPTFLKLTEDQSEAAAAPVQYDEGAVDKATWNAIQKLYPVNANYAVRYDVSIYDDSLQLAPINAGGSATSKKIQVSTSELQSH